MEYQSIFTRSYLNRPEVGLVLPDGILLMLSGIWGLIFSVMSCESELSNGACIAGLFFSALFVTYSSMRTLCLTKGSYERYNRKEWPEQFRD